MREGDDLFFAPGVRFAEVDLEGSRLVDQLRQRVVGFYLNPAALCIEQGHAFAAGVLLLAVIDFLSGLHHPADELADRSVGSDFRAFVNEELDSFGPANLAQRLYDEFRNGLMHEARIKNAGEFSFDSDATARLAGGRLCVNPAGLLTEVQAALDHHLQALKKDEPRRHALAMRLRALFTDEFGIVERARAG